MIFQLFVRQPGFRFLWLKHVTGFDPACHCAKCLLGKYSKLLPFRGTPPGFAVEAEIDDTLARYLYLCGVAGKYSDNLHLVVEAEEGSTAEFEDERIHVKILGARQVSIPELPAEVVATLTAPFHTCRNYRFGWWYLGKECVAEANQSKYHLEDSIESSR